VIALVEFLSENNAVWIIVFVKEIGKWAYICMPYMLPSQAHSLKCDTFQVYDIVFWYLQVVPQLLCLQKSYKMKSRVKRHSNTKHENFIKKNSNRKCNHISCKTTALYLVVAQSFTHLIVATLISSSFCSRSTV